MPARLVLLEEKLRGDAVKRMVLAFCVAWSLVLLCSCTNNANLPHATLRLRDGTTVAGLVKSTSPTDVTLIGDDKTEKTYPMTQVAGIDYDEAAPAAGSPAAAGAGSGSDADHANHHHATQAEIRTKTFRLEPGAQVSVRTEDTIDSGRAVEGQTFAAEITDDVLDADGAVVIPHGSNAEIIIRSASKGNRFRGQSDLVLDLQSVSVEGQQYLLSTTDLEQKGKVGIGKNKRTAEYTGGGAVVGALIGAIAGRGKGALIGAGAGAGAGALTQTITKGGAIKVPAETVLTFKLDKPVQIVMRQ